MSTAVFAAFAAPVAALDQTPFTIRADGRLATGYTDRAPGAGAFVFADATLRLAGGPFGPKTPLGFELGLFGLGDARDTPHETYGTVTWDLSPRGRVFVGVPRPAYDSFAVSALERGFPSLGVSRTRATRSLATHGAMFAHFLPVGARLQGRAGALSFAVSAHHAANVGRSMASLGGAWHSGDWRVAAAFEAGWGRGHADLAAKAQVMRDVGPTGFGFGIFLPGTTGADGLAELFGRHAITDRLEVDVAMQVPVNRATDPTVGISGHYRIRTGTYVQLGVLTDAGHTPNISVSLNIAF